MISGSFSSTGQSDKDLFGIGPFNVSISGGSGTVRVERSFDGGSTWKVVKSITGDYEGIGFEAEHGTHYRVNCTVFTSGPIEYRVGNRSA